MTTLEEKVLKDVFKQAGMTKLEEVLAEEWRSIPSAVGGGAVNTRRPVNIGGDENLYFEGEERGVLLANVMLLGKRALALILRNEWCGPQLATCTECGGHRYAEGHQPWCDWGKICEEARRLG